MPTPSRNEPCPCGSGKRFKHCHGASAATAEAPAPVRPTIDFVVAGAQRAGTTSLDLYLREHRGIAMPMTKKELHFFDDERHFQTEDVGYASYHANFPAPNAWQLRGEATPSYLYWIPAAERMARYNPELKVIVVLRNPITRAHSHWNKERQREREPLSFLEALRAEPERARAALPLQNRRTSYVERGVYCGQLDRLWRHFPAGQTLILRHEALLAETDRTLGQIAAFLGRSPFPRVAPKLANARTYEFVMEPAAWTLLADRFAQEIEDLERLLGWDCADWLRRPEPR